MISCKTALVGMVLASALYAGMGYAQGKFQNGVMTDAEGKTLYTWDKDSPGKSTCTGNCMVSWPLFKAGAADKGSGDWSVITREDGIKQWAYKGQALYYYAKDQKAGDKVGDGGGGGTWHVIKG